MPNPATTDDLAARWRPLASDELTVGSTLLGDAWIMLKRRMTRLGVDIEAQIAADDDLEADAVRVLATAVLRVLKNPDGLVREQIDDATLERGDGAADGRLEFRDDELEDLLPGTSEHGRAYMVDPLAGWAAQWETT
ncbi:Gp19/Gp15/Gp42 family protein [Nocardioides sp.]|uniref:Gp19/Gp15/Gp42 family protein n=1 Tax=Nocardioides sp. TaxID=35761 RepID=UPI003517F6F5